MSDHGLPILTYHALGSGTSPIATDPARFARTMAALAAAGFRSVDLGEWIAGGRPLVDRGFALAFDDGLRSVQRAAEILARYGFRATAFLVTDRIGLDNAWPGQPAGIPRSPLLRWSDLDDLHAAGFRMGAHTRTHPRLDRCSDLDLEEELRASRDAIEEHSGKPCRLVAYPYGYSSPRVRRAAAGLFDAGFGTRLAYASSDQDVFDLSRVDAYYLNSEAALRRLIEGRLRPALRRRRALRAARRVLIGSG